MVTAYLFDRRECKGVDDWTDSIRHLSKLKVLWLDLNGAS
jgi:hypothetical protein